jgi:hypothetical protein
MGRCRIIGGQEILTSGAMLSPKQPHAFFSLVFCPNPMNGLQPSVDLNFCYVQPKKSECTADIWAIPSLRLRETSHYMSQENPHVELLRQSHAILIGAIESLFAHFSSNFTNQGIALKWRPRITEQKKVQLKRL